jgi:hypothetical protein
MTDPKTTRYKDYVIALLVAVILLLGYCLKKESGKNVVLSNDFANELAVYKSDLTYLNDSITALYGLKSRVDTVYKERLASYKGKPVKERIQIAKQFDSTATATDSSITFGINGVDSINKISFAYERSQSQLALSDSIISLKDEVIAKNSAMLVSTVKEASRQTKRANRAVNLNWLLGGGLVVTLIALVL